MKIILEKLMTLRIGAFELALAACVVAALLGTRFELLLAIGTATVFGAAKWRFKGEFTLNDIRGMLKD